MAGEEIPLEVRICAVVDFFDALTMDRPYRKAVANDEVVDMILDQNGTAFEPAVVDLFLTVREEIEVIQSEYLGR